MADLEWALAEWAHAVEPEAPDLALADRSLRDTAATIWAAQGTEIGRVVSDLSETAKLSSMAHALDFDDVHTATATHVGAVIVPAVLAAQGGSRAFLAGAGAMTRVATALGWGHYETGWHITCSAGAPGAAVAASVAMGLTTEQTAHAIALSVVGGGGVRASFGSMGKPLQVGFAAASGVRAALLAKRGARSEFGVLRQWLRLVGCSSEDVDLAGETIPGGLAIKLFPCCFALQRPIAAMRSLLSQVQKSDVTSIEVTTPRDTVQPLVHHQPTNGMQSAFSLEYGLACTLVDGWPTLESFTDEAVHRNDTQELMRCVHVNLTPTGGGLLAGAFALAVRMRNGASAEVTQLHAPGSAEQPPTLAELESKAAACGASDALEGLTWENAVGVLRGGLWASCPDGAKV